MGHKRSKIRVNGSSHIKSDAQYRKYSSRVLAVAAVVERKDQDMPPRRVPNGWHEEIATILQRPGSLCRSACNRSVLAARSNGGLGSLAQVP